MESDFKAKAEVSESGISDTPFHVTLEPALTMSGLAAA